MKFRFVVKGLVVPEPEIKCEEMEIEFSFSPEMMKEYTEWLRNLPEPFKNLMEKAITKLQSLDI